MNLCDTSAAEGVDFLPKKDLCRGLDKERVSLGRKGLPSLSSNNRSVPTAIVGFADGFTAALSSEPG